AEAAMLDNAVVLPAGRGTARALLARAAELYDGPDDALRTAALPAGRQGFASGAEWMRLVLEALRSGPLQTDRASYQLLGLVKYGLATIAALAWLALSFSLGLLPLGAFAVLVFYAVEAQMVFLFPVALDGSARPFRDARRWTGRAGGTVAV